MAEAHLHDQLCSNVSEDSWEGAKGERHSVESTQGMHGKVVNPKTNPLMEQCPKKLWRGPCQQASAKNAPSLQPRALQKQRRETKEEESS